MRQIAVNAVSLAVVCIGSLFLPTEDLQWAPLAFLAVRYPIHWLGFAAFLAITQVSPEDWFPVVIIPYLLGMPIRIWGQLRARQPLHH